jgi:hypothetical protein
MKTVIEMAREAGLNPVNCMGSNLELFEHFADLVRAEAVAREREECARVCDDLHPGLATKRAAEIIRARKENT